MSTHSWSAEEPEWSDAIRTRADGVIQLPLDLMADPYSTYAFLRSERPVARAKMGPGPAFWLVTRYADVRAGLADPRLAKDAAALGTIISGATGASPAATRADLQLHDHMLNSDPPRHTRLRKLVNKAFTGRAIAALQPRIEALAIDLIDQVAAELTAGRQPVDLVDTFAFPLPMTVICEILGVPDDRRTEFGAWSHEILAPTSLEGYGLAAVAMKKYLTQLVADKQTCPGDDILSAALAPDENADRLSSSDAIGMASLLLVAGHETTVNLISSGALMLILDPAKWARLRGNPDLLPSAVEEFLRLDSPVNVATMRYTTEPVTIGGTMIPAGEVVLLSIGSANRDQEVFDQPDDFDLDRAAGRGIAFGHGIHHCLGAALARLEGEIAFRILLDRLPTLTLAVDADKLVWHNGILLRGLVQLPVRATG